MTLATNLGFPRIGRRRELKTALETFWAGKSDESALRAEAARLCATHTDLQAGFGIAHVPSGDSSLYDGVLDTACMMGAIPPGYGWQSGPVSLATYFALARGTSGAAPDHAAEAGRPALEMTKWFDTNYHFLVPRLSRLQRFELTGNRPLDFWREQAERGVATRPVLLGPVSFLLLSKTDDDSDPLDLLDALLPLYRDILDSLHGAGVEWVQMDEPALVLDPRPGVREAFAHAYAVLSEGGPRLLLASYFGPVADLDAVLALPVAGLHLDLVRGLRQLERVLRGARQDQFLSLGVVDGRNVWRTDLYAALATLRRAALARGTERLMVAPSCSLLHVPVDLAEEAGRNSSIGLELRGWLAFATQKLAEVVTLTLGLDEGDDAIAPALARSGAVVRSRAVSPRVHNVAVAARLAAVTPGMAARTTPFSERRLVQRARTELPDFPTTTIGSFPQTKEVREARAAVGRGAIGPDAYDTAIAAWIADAVRWQEQLGLDVLVHGEFERNDMVKYFGEQLAGFAFSRHGWVQSYGSRCVAPPIIWGDVSRPAPMSVRWAAYAQSLTDRPVKGMLTGPVTMLQWSFVRDDVARETVCRQVALALRDEVADLEAAGIPIIQVDEPALREGLPLTAADRDEYLRWAVACFGLATSGVQDDTQVHTHMCYSEFNDIMQAIAALDADAISIETTRSRMELLDAFAPEAGGSTYPNEIGPGVWDIHSPRVPTAEEMAELLGLARARLADWQIWVNPDCGLKTRSWDEVRPALANMVAAARSLRANPETGREDAEQLSA